jgi:hypothetical protein
MRWVAVDALLDDLHQIVGMASKKANAKALEAGQDESDTLIMSCVVRCFYLAIWSPSDTTITP